MVPRAAPKGGCTQIKTASKLGTQKRKLGRRVPCGNQRASCEGVAPEVNRKKNDFILKKLKENAFIQKNFFSPFLLLALKRCEQPSCLVQPGPRYRRAARTRRSGRGTRDADIAPRNVGGTTPSRPSRSLMPPRLSSSSGGVLSRRLAEFPRLGSWKTN